MPARSKRLLAGEVLVLIVAGAVAAVDSTADEWRPPELFGVLLALALASALLAVRHRSQRISGAFLALVLAMALLGPAPAAAIGVISVLVDQLRARNPLPRLITNLATWATFPLIGGLLIAWAVDGWDISEEDVAFYLLIFGAFLVANLLNFLGI